MARTPVLGTGHFPGSSPGLPTIYGVVAQLGEHLSGRQEVASSILVDSTIYPDIGQLELLRMIRDHEIAGLNPAIRTILEPILISFGL